MQRRELLTAAAQLTLGLTALFWWPREHSNGHCSWGWSPRNALSENTWTNNPFLPIFLRLPTK